MCKKKKKLTIVTDDKKKNKRVNCKLICDIIRSFIHSSVIKNRKNIKKHTQQTIMLHNLLYVIN